MHSNDNDTDTEILGILVPEMLVDLPLKHALCEIEDYKWTYSISSVNGFYVHNPDNIKSNKHVVLIVESNAAELNTILISDDKLRWVLDNPHRVYVTNAYTK